LKINDQKISLYPAPIRVGILIWVLLLVWLPLAIPLYFLLRDDPNLQTIVIMGLLFSEYLILLKFWGQKVYQENLLKRYGLTWTRKTLVYLLQGLSIGLIFVIIFFGFLKSLNFITIQKPELLLIKVILEGLISALGIAFAEELFFRGWLLDELARDYQNKTVIFGNSFLFATLHFFKPLTEIMRTLPQFPGLFLLGITLIFAKKSHRNNLGICIGLHGGLVWGYYIFNVGELVKYSEAINPWIIGVDQNPIAGLIGITLLMIMMLTMIKK
jgi:membrane protease YdiL (CAAX protease family)